MTVPNPMLSAWDTPYGLPPFDQVRPEHFGPAFEAAIAEHRDELDAIVRAEPGFEASIVGFDRSGATLERIHLLFDNLSASETSPELQAVERELAPRLAAHYAAVRTDEALFARIAAVFRRRHKIGLDRVARRLVERIHLDFELAGSRLRGRAKVRYLAIVQELATLTTQFEQNVLADEAGWTRALGDAEAAGLPDALVATLEAAAAQRGQAGSRLVALSRSLVMPVLTHAADRSLREAVWRAWTDRGCHDGPHDNRPIARQILALRAEQAHLLGHDNFADAALVDRMAGRPQAVLDLLHRVWEPALAAAERDREALSARAARDGVQLSAWDWRYYAERERQERFAVDDAEVRPYFALDAMIGAMFDCAGRLFGLRFEERRGVPLYHPDVRLWEVKRGDTLIGLFLGDNFARPTKRGGAWCHVYRRQRYGELPIVVNNNNFAQSSPALLTADDVRTLFHEFGHALHALLSEVPYARLSSTEVLQDFVELPSQLYEHWAKERTVLRQHARHVRTGAPIPDDLLDRIEAAGRFDQAFGTVQYVGSALVDMALHAHPEGVDVDAAERHERARLGVPDDIGLMHRPAHFRHLFAGDAYAAGYYVYMWAEVLDADAFEAFEEAGDPFDAATAERLHRFVYAAGNRQPPADAYRAFRGRGPRVEAMLRKRGLLDNA